MNAVAQAVSRQPAVSVLLPVFNAEKFLRKTIESLLEQTFRDFEIVAIDDGSTDGSRQILDQCTDPRLRVIHNERNLGLIETLNRGIGFCAGEYVARMDADDVAMPTRLERQYQFMQAHDDVILVGSYRLAIDENDNLVQSFNRPATDAPIIRWKLLTGNFITHPTVMIRKSALHGELFEARYKHSEDYAAWLKLLKHGEFAIIPEPLLKYRFHPSSVSHTHRDSQVKSAMDALAQHIWEQYSTTFTFNSLALWSAPEDVPGLAGRGDYFALLRWMNPLRSVFRQHLPGATLFKAFLHYQRRLVFLLIAHKKRPELLARIVAAIALSLIPQR
jgi:glycosyltransferase involved in cell wall biosynthesis